MLRFGTAVTSVVADPSVRPSGMTQSRLVLGRRPSPGAVACVLELGMSAGDVFADPSVRPSGTTHTRPFCSRRFSPGASSVMRAL